MRTRPEANVPYAELVTTRHMSFYDYRFTIGKSGKKFYTYQVSARTTVDLENVHIGYTIGGGRWEEKTVIPAGTTAFAVKYFLTGEYAGKYQVRIDGGYRMLDSSQFELLEQVPSVKS